jgi:hypothetical protein
MKFNSYVSNFLTNKLVLNIVAILAFLNVIGYAVIGNFNTVVYFIVIAVLVRYFSKNMTIVLGVPLIIVNLFSLKGNIMEGLENNSPNTNNNISNGVNKKPNSDQEKINNLVKNNSNKPESKTSQGLVMHPLDNPNDNSDDSHLDNTAQTTGGEQQGFEPGRRKNRGYEIDYATTIEDAYDQLNNILGSDGIKRLTSDSQNLMKQQMQLAEAMKGMGPVIEQIAPMVENLKGMMGQMGDGKEGLGGLMDLAKKFSSQASPAK